MQVSEEVQVAEGLSDVQRAENALKHLLFPILSHPDSCSVNAIEGKSVVIVEVSVHREDFAALNEGEDGDSLFQSLQRLISVTSKERKMSLDLLEVPSEEA